MRITKTACGTLQSGYNLDRENPDCKGLRSGYKQAFQQVANDFQIVFTIWNPVFTIWTPIFTIWKFHVEKQLVAIVPGFYNLDTIWIGKFQIVNVFSQSIQSVECEIPDCKYNLEFQSYNLDYSTCRTIGYT